MVDDIRYANGTVEQSRVDTFGNVPNYLLSYISFFGENFPLLAKQAVKHPNPSDDDTV
jgi:hypothetical protein